MKVKSALILCAVLCGTAAMAQTNSPAPVHQQPGVASPKPATTAPEETKPTMEKVDPAKEAAIRHLMDVTQASKLGDNINTYITNQVRNVMSHSLSPDKMQPFMDAFGQKFSAAAPPSAVTAAMVPIYARLLSTEDVQGLIQFYESPLGQRTLKALPQVTQESENAGVQIEQKAAMDTLQGMTDQYPELKSMLAPQGQGAPAPGAQGPPPPSLTPAVPQK